jgi:predicted ATP-grasp superfamily ATP-dependent carboligase
VLDPRDLYETTDLAAEPGEPVLVVALTGFVDAGNAATLAREHLIETCSPELVATFDVDQLHDYRARRPTMVFVEDHWESYEAPTLELHRLTDTVGHHFLMLHGSEPDVQWERFASAVGGLADDLGVRLSIGLNSIPMAVPHTRPTGVTVHASRPELLEGYEPWLQSVQVPGSAAHLLEFRLAQAGKASMGFATHVPHYLAQTDYPSAAELLLTSVAGAGGLVLNTEALHAAAERIRDEVDQQIGPEGEVADVVHALEAQYDAYVRGRQGTNLIAGNGPLPTADELAAELERFLADHSESGEQRDLGDLG